MTLIDRRRRSLGSSSEIGKYQVRRPIHMQNGRALLEAYDPFLDRSVAIKTIQLFDPSIAFSQHANETFFSEARAIGRLQHHNIVSVYDAGMGDYEGYIVMEYVEGESLEEMLKAQSRLPIRQVIKIALQVCAALQYAHSKNIIHRDIKSSNIMVTHDQQVKLVDFGISVEPGCQSDTPEFVGTPSYMAPELIDVGTPDQLSDQFSLGVLLYEMVKGELPFTGKDIHTILYKILYQNPEPLSQGNRLVPSIFCEIVDKCMEKNPQQRFSSMLDLTSSLKNALLYLEQGSDELSLGNTQELLDTKLFDAISAQTLSELANCCEFESYTVNQEIQSMQGQVNDDYYCLLAGDVLTDCKGVKTKISGKKWFYSPAAQVKYPGMNTTALSDVQVLRVSSKALESKSLATQLYFYKSVSDQLYLNS